LEIGKAAIVAALIPYEKDHVLFNVGDWYQYLFARLNSSFDCFGKNLGIITFNYDRSLEFYLVTALHHSFGKPLLDCHNVLKGIPFIHLHGQLGPFECDAWRPYEPKNFRDAVLGCSNEIKIIHETEDNSPQFNDAYNLLKSVERVCFLGFGYDETNLRRLLKGTRVLESKWVIGTAFGLTEAEKHSIRGRVHGDLQLKDRSHDNLTVLRESGVLH
jgi:hypothetical protein